MEMGVVGKDMSTYLGILDTTRGKSNIGHHVIKVVDDKTGPIIWQMNNEEINQHTEDKAILKLEHGIDPWEKLIEDERI